MTKLNDLLKKQLTSELIRLNSMLNDNPSPYEKEIITAKIKSYEQTLENLKPNASKV